MKKYILCSFILLFSVLQGFSQGIAFEETSWNEVVKKAKELNKPIFVDVYTTWCGPCKIMDAQIFPRPEIGAKYNNGFINVKIDAEKGEGIEIAKKYQVKAFPTYLFIRPSDESLIDQTLGSVGASEFNDLADRMLLKFSGKKESSLEELNAIYKADKYDETFAQTYIKRLKTEKKSTQEALGKYLNKFMANNPTEDQLYFLGLNFELGAEPHVHDYVINNYKTIDAVLLKNDGIAAASFDRAIFSSISRVINKTLSDKQLSVPDKEMQLNKLFEDISTVTSNPSKRDKKILDTKNQFYRLNADTLRLLEVSRLYITKFILPFDQTSTIGREALVLDKNEAPAVLSIDSSGAANWSSSYAISISKLSNEKQDKDLAKQVLKKAAGLSNSFYIKNMENIVTYNFGGRKEAIKQQSALLNEMKKANNEYLADAEVILQKMKNNEPKLSAFSYKM